ncbi:MAG: aminopeptidase P family N-terminal domain-containing protein, partial [Nitrospinota bacterium]
MPYNKARILELMREHDLTAIIGTTLENVTYLTGHVGWAQRVYRARKCHALLTSDPGAGTDLIMNRADNTYYAAYGGHAENVYCYGGQAYHVTPEGYEPGDEEFRRYLELHESGGRHKTLLDALLAALKNRGVTRGRIALDEEGCTEALFAALREKLPACEFLPGSGLFLMARLVKTDEELDRLRAAARVNEDAIAEVFGFVREGVSE